VAKSLEQKLQELVDKDEIRDVMFRYCRAADRCDSALFKSCYWPDARDHHGFFVGNAHAFVDYVVPVLQQALSTTHQLGNVLIELDGERACAESYVHVTHRRGAGDPAYLRFDVVKLDGPDFALPDLWGALLPG
jgi:hypothetical protein